MALTSTTPLSPAALAGQHALVTGGGRGIGRAVAAALARAGAAVSVIGRTESTLRETVADGAAHAYAVADMTIEDELVAAHRRLAGELGPVAILVNNAGHVETAPILKSDTALVRRLLELNLVSLFVAVRCVLPGMISRGHGRIINIASTSALKGYPYTAAYCASKHGVLGLTRALAREVGPTGVTVNAVCPGYVESDLLRTSVARIKAKTGRAEDEIRAELVKGNPQGRLITPEEVAAAVLYLVGPDAAAVNGIALPVAGGEVC